MGHFIRGIDQGQIFLYLVGKKKIFNLQSQMVTFALPSLCFDRIDAFGDLEFTPFTLGISK